MEAWQPEVVVVGAACLDIKGYILGPVHQATSNPGRVRISIGGVARNIAENLARLGTRTTLLAVVTRDPFGQQIVKHTGAAGVDVSQVLFTREERTGAYLAIVDGEGTLMVAVDDTAAMAELTPRYVYQRRRLFRGARMAVLDANVPLETARTVLRIAQRYGVPVCLDPVSYELARRYRELIGHFYLLTCGEIEVEALLGQPATSRREATVAARQLVSAGVGVALILLRGGGVVYATTEDSGYVPALRCPVVDPTGAADALTATVIYGLVNGFPLDEAVWLGVSAATVTLQSTETVRSDLSLDLLYQQLVS
ncbi:MAG: carbohydrate kinase family protein [Chloroflexia bacterium]